jgi:hypothetical protein
VSSQGETGPLYKKTGAEHFSALSGKRTPESQIPPCAACGKPALGAHILAPQNSIKVGAELCPVYEVVFQCAAHGIQPFEIYAEALYPHYRTLSQDGYRMRLMRLTRPLAEQRVKGK